MQDACHAADHARACRNTFDRISPVASSTFIPQRHQVETEDFHLRQHHRRSDAQRGMMFRLALWNPLRKRLHRFACIESRRGLENFLLCQPKDLIGSGNDILFHKAHPQLTQHLSD